MYESLIPEPDIHKELLIGFLSSLTRYEQHDLLDNMITAALNIDVDHPIFDSPDCERLRMKYVNHEAIENVDIEALANIVIDLGSLVYLAGDPDLDIDIT